MRRLRGLDAEDVVLWVLQNKFHSEPGYSRLVDVLGRLRLPHVVVKPVPFTHRLLPAKTDTASAERDIDDIDEVEIDVGQAIIPMGSYTLAQIGVRRGWRPGALLANLDYAAWSKAWGAQRVLNPDARVMRFGDADFDADDAFVRPVEDSKAFAGKVFERGEWRGWKKRVLSSAQSSDPLHADTEVLIAPPVVIYTETRCWIVGGEVVTVSGYKRGKHVFYTAGADDEVLAFARDTVAQWMPNSAFVLDIAQTPAGCRVVEVNCLNAAGFYAADTMRLVAALEDHRW